jgi:arylformamidase
MKPHGVTGRHLAAMLLATDWPSFVPGLPRNLVKAVCAIGGIFDLEPIRLSFLNDILHLTSEQVVRCSPIRQRYPVPAPLLLVVGTNESDEFRRQSTAMKCCFETLGYGPSLVAPEGLDHFTVLDQLRRPNCALVDLQLEHMRRAFG